MYLRARGIEWHALKTFVANVAEHGGASGGTDVFRGLWVGSGQKGYPEMGDLERAGK
jgi:hypothetical protein